MNLLVVDRRTLVTFRARGENLTEASKVADKIAAFDGLGAETIEWAIEEYGRCDGMEYTIFPEQFKEQDI